MEKTNTTEIKLQPVVDSIKNYIKENTRIEKDYNSGEEFKSIDPAEPIEFIDNLIIKFGLERW